MPVTDTDVVVQEVLIHASPETVFEFFTDPTKMILWKGLRAELDPRPGGVYRVEMTDEATIRGEYLSVEPYERVIFTWGWEAEGNPVPPGSSVVDITLTPEADGTRVRLEHRDLPQETLTEHDKGWSAFMPRLVACAQGSEPGPYPYQ